ncbi:hypothetical protein GCK72_003016 [Caenorhabditis remanei]|uniref:Sdz-33 F-box domain-containing protein n=1 Tax=Caenorhabditis remanei TaxID=31234 RepID=A0A6A5HSN1_CAERE|nr:hypothetical protein GCK72_003016 [Caenorhabditis remanei]KAF1771190.1 hypothetical protein GCK72_003016 [Caenorhabditis remanei]
MLFDLQLEFKKLSISLKRSMEENLLWNQISSNLLLVKYLSVLSTPDTAFIPVFPSWPQNIWIMNSVWFTLESLLMCTCTRITLWNSLLGNKDLDEVLRNWKAGGFPNLEYLYVGSHNITNNSTTILGMNPMELDGMTIQTDDGSKKATIYTGYGSVVMSVTPL